MRFLSLGLLPILLVYAWYGERLRASSPLANEVRSIVFHLWKNEEAIQVRQQRRLGYDGGLCRFDIASGIAWYRVFTAVILSSFLSKSTPFSQLPLSTGNFVLELNIETTIIVAL
jgi:hypothetical protein